MCFLFEVPATTVFYTSRTPPPLHDSRPISRRADAGQLQGPATAERQGAGRGRAVERRRQVRPGDDDGVAGREVGDRVVVVVAGRAAEGIVAGAAGQQIVAGTADQQVVSGHSRELVRPAAAGQRVVAPAAGDRKSTRLHSSHYCATRLPTTA